MVLDFAAVVKCPNGHSGQKDEACLRIDCPTCHVSFCYAHGGGKAECDYFEGCSQFGALLKHLTGFEMATDGNQAVQIFYLKRTQAFLMLVKDMVHGVRGSSSLWADNGQSSASRRTGQWAAKQPAVL